MRYLKFYRHLLPFWKKEVLILFLSMGGVGFSLINPYLTKLIIDKAYGNKDLNLFIILIILGGVIFALTGIFNGLTDYLNNLIKIRLSFDLNRKLFKKLQTLSYGFFQDSSTGQHLVKMSRDTEEAVRFIADGLPDAISLIPRSAFIIVIVLRLNWQMALLSLLLAPFLYILPYYFSRRLEKVWRGWIENYEKFFSRLQESLSHIQLIKTFGREQYEVRRFVGALIKNIRFNFGNTKLEVTGSFVNNLINRIVLGLIIFYGGYQVIKGNMTLGTLSAITIYLNQLSGLQSSLAAFFQQMSRGRVSCQRLEGILNLQPETTEAKFAKKFVFPSGEIEFKNVIFGYKPEKKVLEDLTFSIAAGSCVGLVGYSGCGKTTISNLILRLYSPLSGKIFIDGCDISNIESKSFYEQIGAVLQEPYLWNDTIEYNIKYGREDSGLEEVKWAAQIACIGDFVNTLPQEYATVIGENACKISEGQKQRIAIARAVIKSPKILILDEALSSVDAQIEGMIIDNIKESFPQSTVIVISHRFSTIMKMDLIYFLSGPDKIDIGTHEELLSRSSAYREYLAHQINFIHSAA